MPAVFQRPDRSLPSSRAQTTSAAKPLASTWTVCSPISSPVAGETAAIVCERLWVSAPSTIIDLVHLHGGELTRFHAVGRVA